VELAGSVGRGDVLMPRGRRADPVSTFCGLPPYTLAARVARNGLDDVGYGSGLLSIVLAVPFGTLVKKGLQ
jgi:hypothetical protein